MLVVHFGKFGLKVSKILFLDAWPMVILPWHLFTLDKPKKSWVMSGTPDSNIPWALDEEEAIKQIKLASN